MSYSTSIWDTDFPAGAPLLKMIQGISDNPRWSLNVYAARRLYYILNDAPGVYIRHHALSGNLVRDTTCGVCLPLSVFLNGLLCHPFTSEVIVIRGADEGEYL